MTFIQKKRAKNVDEIDTKRPKFRIDGKREKSKGIKEEFKENKF